MSVVVVSAIFALLAGCTTVPVDLGVYNPADADVEDLVDVTIMGFIEVSAVDGEEVDWSQGRGFPDRVVKLAPGIHVLEVRYKSAQQIALASQEVIANLKAGDSYVVGASIQGGRVSYSIVSSTGETAMLDVNALRGESEESMMSRFLKYVMNPTMDEVGKTVRMANDSMVLSFYPDMVFEMTNKNTGETTVGRRGFIMDLAMTEGTLYLLETDTDAMSREEFLESSDYTQNADFTLIPIACTQDSVTLEYVTPAERAGEQLVLSIEIVD